MAADHGQAGADCIESLESPATVANRGHNLGLGSAFPICMSRFGKARTDAHRAEHQTPWILNQGDCLTGMSLLPDATADVVISDPPYEAEAHTRASGWSHVLAANSRSSR